MSRCYEAEARVLNGFPVLVQFTAYSPEPDVGFPGGLEIDALFTIQGKPAGFIHKKMKPKDWQLLADDLYSSQEDWTQL